MNFDDLNLEVIDLRMMDSPKIFLNPCGLTLNKAVLEKLEYPDAVQFFIDPNKSIFAIKACSKNDDKAVSFWRTKKNSSIIPTFKKRNLIEVLSAMVQNYSEDKRYSIDGVFDEKHHIMLFEMKNAKESPHHFSKKSN